MGCGSWSQWGGCTGLTLLSGPSGVVWVLVPVGGCIGLTLLSGPSGVVWDSSDERISLYDDTEPVLKLIHSQGMQIAIASR